MPEASSSLHPWNVRITRPAKARGVGIFMTLSRGGAAIGSSPREAARLPTSRIARCRLAIHEGDAKVRLLLGRRSRLPRAHRRNAPAPAAGFARKLREADRC